jgi:hypothetical protein
MARHPRKRTIAEALGISPAAFSRYIARGCPVHSIEAAKSWQRQFVDPSQRLAQQRARQQAPARAGRGDGIDRMLQEALAAGERAGMRRAFDWLWVSPQIAAAALIRHGGQAPADAARLGFIAAAALHSAGIELHELTDAELGETFAGHWRGNLSKVRAELPDLSALEVRAAELARDLWPPASDPA